MAVIAVPVQDYNNVTDPRNARICYEQVITTAVTSGAGVMLTQNTYERVTVPDASESYQFTFADTEIDYIAIAGHSLGTKGATIEISYDLGAGGDTVIATLSPSDDRPILLTFDEVEADEINLLVTGGTGAEMAHIRAGKALVMERALYGGHSPINLSAKTEYQSNMSDTGQFLGRTITRKGTESSFSWRHLTPEWYRQYFQPFVDFAKTGAFFIQWRPDQYPDEVSYCYTTKDIQPSNMSGGIRLMEVSMTVRGHDDV